MAIRRYYFRATDGSLLGPFNLNSVAELVRGQKVRANTPVSVDGQNFQPTKTLPELAILLSVDTDNIAPPDEVDEAMVEERHPTYSGSFSDVSFPKMLYHFFAARACGRLQVGNQSLKKEFFLDGGKIIAANSNLKRDQLGQHLVRAGRFGQEEMERILKEAKNARMRLGDYLTQQKLVEPHELFRLLVDQFKEKVFEVFEWRTGVYSFFDGERYEGSLLPINQNPWELITEGVRRGYQLKELEELFRPYLDRLLVPRENPQLHINQLSLMPLENKLLREAGQQRTLGYLLKRLADNDEKRRTLLYSTYMFLELELLVIGPQVVDTFQEEIPGASDWEEEMIQVPDSQSAESIQTTPPVGRVEQGLLEKLNQLKKQDFFERLGLERNATSTDVSKVFIREARKYHPDQLPPEASESLRELTSQIFALLNEAQEKLGDDKSRREYLDMLEAGLESDQVDVSHILEAESIFHSGERLLAARRYAAALQAFEKAVKLNPDEGEFQVYRGFAMFMSKQNPDQRHLKLCEDAILAGLKARGNNLAPAFLFLGLIKKQSGDIDLARKMFRKALSLDGNLTEAKRELRLLEKRDEKKGGFFRRK